MANTLNCFTPQSTSSDRRFGGIDRLYGPGSYHKLRSKHVLVIGLGGVGSWAVEALGRCGIGHFTLIDFDIIAESNVNRQIQALTPHLGQNKGAVLQERLLHINPDAQVDWIDDFLTPDNAVQYLEQSKYDGLIDATDQMSAKIAICDWLQTNRLPAIICGAAGGKTDSRALRTGDLSEATHDRLLAKLRSALRHKQRIAQRGNADNTTPVLHRPISKTAKPNTMGIEVVYSIEPMRSGQRTPSVRGLQCAGYGSSICVTAPMGFLAAERLLAHWL